MTPEERKQRPVFSGVIAYFPDAIMEVAYCSWVGNEQHNPGEPLHWAKEKSTDHPDAELRHAIDALSSKFDSDGVRHKAKKAWRALADLQTEINEEKITPEEKVATYENVLKQIAELEKNNPK
jgi:hypothetical protein